MQPKEEIKINVEKGNDYSPIKDMLNCVEQYSCKEKQQRPLRVEYPKSINLRYKKYKGRP